MATGNRGVLIRWRPWVIGACLMVGGCTGPSYATGIPERRADRIFDGLKDAAREEGYTLYDRREFLHIRTGDEGAVEFFVEDGSIKMIVLPETAGLYQSEIKDRRAYLRRTGEWLLERARRIADDS